jgi:hypothetical protein
MCLPIEKCAGCVPWLGSPGISSSCATPIRFGAADHVCPEQQRFLHVSSVSMRMAERRPYVDGEDLSHDCACGDEAQVNGHLKGHSKLDG